MTGLNIPMETPADGIAAQYPARISARPPSAALQQSYTAFSLAATNRRLPAPRSRGTLTWIRPAGSIEDGVRFCFDLAAEDTDDNGDRRH